MAADPSSLALAMPWRKSTRSGGGGCVEAALATVLRRQPMINATPAGVGPSIGRASSAG